MIARSRQLLLVSSLALAVGAAACGTDEASSEPDITTLDTSSDTGTVLPDVGTPDVGLPDTDEPDTDLPDTDLPDTDEPDTDEPDTDLPDIVIPARCDDDAQCDDGIACTDDACVEGVCAWTIEEDACLINGVCAEAGDADPRNACAACDPATNNLGYSPRNEGDRCDDGSVCTIDTVCVEGACVGTDITCDDGESCTADNCDPVAGCTFEPVDNGTSCDDGTTCTEADRCVAGACAGDAIDCDDGNPCTANGCGEDGLCFSEVLVGASCSDGNACTTGDTCNEDGSCGGGTPRVCDDGNECTIDICDPFVGCAYVPNLSPCCTGTVSVCDDGDPCTTDLCDAETGGCAYVSNTAVCDDGNACTADDQCGDGVCSGSPVVCPTTGPCQASFCDEEDGCGIEPLNGVACDDGVACTVDDLCVEGACVGTSECVCEPEIGLENAVVTAVSIGTTPTVRPEFCDRVTACADGVANALNFVAGFANDPLVDAIAGGSFTLLLDFDSLGLNPVGLQLNTGEPVSLDCEPTTTTCEYLISASSLDADTCESFVALDLTRAGNGLFIAGPPAVFPFDVPLDAETTLSLTVYEARFFGELAFEGDAFSGLDGLIAGAVRKTDLIDTLRALPDGTLPLDTDQIVNLINALVTSDVDTDGDGTNDAASIALLITADDARITGVAR